MPRGQIIKRSKSSWSVRIFTGRDDNGRRQYHNKTIQGKKSEAEQYLTNTLKQMSDGTFIEPSDLSLGKYLDEWLKAAAKPRVSERTFADYSEVLDRYIRPALKDIKVSHVRPLQIQAVYSDMLERGLSSRSVRYAHTVLSSALKQAVKWRMLAYNPAQNVELPKRVRREMQTLDAEQATAFLEATEKDPHGVIFAFGLATGMRPEEYLALQWKDLKWAKDLTKGSVTVQRVLCWRRKKGGWYFSEPKTPQSRRTLPLPPSIVRTLAHHKANQSAHRLKLGEKYQNLDLVFATAHGGPLHHRNLAKRNFRSICEAAELPDFVTPYTLRHTCATLLLLAGENPKVVSERLGHASITLTLDTYSHVLPSMQQAATDKLENMLFSKFGTQPAHK